MPKYPRRQCGIRVPDSIVVVRTLIYKGYTCRNATCPWNCQLRYWNSISCLHSSPGPPWSCNIEFQTDIAPDPRSTLEFQVQLCIPAGIPLQLCAPVGIPLLLQLAPSWNSTPAPRFGIPTPRFGIPAPRRCSTPTRASAGIYVRTSVK